MHKERKENIRRIFDAENINGCLTEKANGINI